MSITDKRAAEHEELREMLRHLPAQHVINLSVFLIDICLHNIAAARHPEPGVAQIFVAGSESLVLGLIRHAEGIAKEAGWKQITTGSG